jgi:hypothetical protein
MKIKYIISNGTNEFSEIENLDDEEKIYNESELLDSDGKVRPAKEVCTFEHYTRPIQIDDINVKGALDKINSPPDYHIAFGWIECIAQSDERPSFMSDEHVSLKVERV